MLSEGTGFATMWLPKLSARWARFEQKVSYPLFCFTTVLLLRICVGVMTENLTQRAADGRNNFVMILQGQGAVKKSGVRGHRRNADFGVMTSG